MVATMEEFIKFASQDERNYMEYLKRFRITFKEYIAFVNPTSLNRVALKGLKSMVMFANLDKHLEFSKFLEFDLKKLLDE